MEARKSELPYLPDDAITEILLRSPVKSVGRFRCLSKLFCSLLSDPKFARKQLELTLRRSDVVRSHNRRLIISWPKLFLVDLDSIDVEREYSLKEDKIFLSKLRENPKSKKKMSFLSDMGIYTGWSIDIMGSSNGLVCVQCARIFRDQRDKILLYNPTTKDSKIIPELSESLYCKPHHQWSWGYGFGFDALTNDYKVVKLVSCKDEEHKHSICYVYSLKTDSWRRINNLLPYYTDVYVSTTNLKGAIHWIARTERVEDHIVLMAFDLDKDELREMSLPNWAEEFDQDMRYCAVDTLKGCLCVVQGCFNMHNIIWVMKEYGLESSWSKIKINVSEYSIKPLSLSKNDDEVVVLDGHFVYTKQKTPLEKFYLKTNASTYVESLISPNSYGEQR